MHKESKHCYRFVVKRKSNKTKTEIRIEGRVSRPVGQENKHWRIYCDDLGISGLVVCDGTLKGHFMFPHLEEVFLAAMRRKRNGLVTLLAGLGVNSEKEVEWQTSTSSKNRPASEVSASTPDTPPLSSNLQQNLPEVQTNTLFSASGLLPLLPLEIPSPSTEESTPPQTILAPVNS
jgi:hypothetical protein